MNSDNKIKHIKKMALDNFSRYLDESIDEYLFLSEGKYAPTIEDVEYLFGRLAEQNYFNMSQFFSNLVSYSDKEEMILDCKKKRGVSSFTA